jgi:hypothetical protein
MGRMEGKPLIIHGMLEAMIEEYNAREKEPPIMPATIHTMRLAYSANLCRRGSLDGFR